jgi:hypothetical protein
VDFNVIGQQLITFSICQILEKSGSIMVQYVSYYGFQESLYDSFIREVLYSILIEFGIDRKLVC